MISLLKEKFGFDRFERDKMAFFERQGWKFMPFAQRDPMPDPHLLVPRQVEEVNKLLDMVREGDLVSFITSDVGLGKTALCRFLAETLPKESKNMKVVFLQAPSVETPEQMLYLILTRLGLEVKERDLTSEFEQFRQWHESYPDLQLVVIIDEFPDLDGKTAEMVRTLADMRGVALILNGQREPLLRFIEEKIPALMQRRRMRLDIKPMSLSEVNDLLALRMAWARGADYNNPPIAPFTPEAVERIHNVSGGIPREALKVAGDAVYTAIKQKSEVITPQMVRGVAKPVKPPIYRPLIKVKAMEIPWIWDIEKPEKPEKPKKKRDIFGFLRRRRK